MTQQEFNNLSKRYLDGKTTEEEDEILNKWLNTLPQTSDLTLSSIRKDVIENRIWTKILNRIRPKNFIFFPKGLWVSGIAACVILGFLWFNPSKIGKNNFPTSSEENNLEKVGIELKNTTRSEQEVKLDDGTIILLKQNSSIVYDKSFNQINRTVFLRGEAFFKVKRNPLKPFIVHAGGLITEVLGTSFRIKPNDKTNVIEVVVSTGKVSVYSEKSNKKDERNGVILTPNQKVVFDVESKNIISSIVENPIPINTFLTEKEQFFFKSTPLQNVLNTLSEVYGIEFIITNPEAKECQITADLNGLSMFMQLELICKSIDATYEKRGTAVFINGEGCQ
jgi:hypothetical protein